MAARVARGERMLAKLSEKLGITPKGEHWLIGALDPFHDTPLEVCGYPDGNKNPVCVQLVRQSYNLQCPAAITTGTWDAMIMSLPWLKLVPFDNSVLMGGTNTNPTNEIEYAVNGSGSNIPMGGMTNILQQTGTGFNLAQNGPSSTNTVSSTVIPDQYTLGNYRIIGKAFEVHNTTSDLNRQGMLTSWVIPVGDYQNSGMYRFGANISGTATPQGDGNYFTVPMWPSSQSNAVLIPGSRQWTAEQGAYVIPRLEAQEIPISEQGFPIQPFIDGGDVTNAAVNLASRPLNSSIFSNQYVFKNCFWDSFDMRGVLLSGLSLQTTLTVNVTYLVERMPDVTISDLVVLAVPPPERDAQVLDLYTHISDHLPSAVPVGENGLGDWFMDALSTAADFIAPVASAIPGVGGAISAGIGGLNTLYKTHKAAYATNPYAAVTAREIGGVYNAASSVVGQLQKNREKKAVKQEVKQEIKKEFQYRPVPMNALRKLNGQKGRQRRRGKKGVDKAVANAIASGNY